MSQTDGKHVFAMEFWLSFSNYFRRRKVSLRVAKTTRDNIQTIHFELSPPGGDCSKRVIEVEVWKEPPRFATYFFFNYKTSKTYFDVFLVC